MLFDLYIDISKAISLLMDKYLEIIIYPEDNTLMKIAYSDSRLVRFNKIAMTNDEIFSNFESYTAPKTSIDILLNRNKSMIKILEEILDDITKKNN